jgi:hypothetical protein
VPRRPGGGASPPESVEAGLRELVLDAGPDIRKLSRAPREGLRTIMQAAQVPADWPTDAKAAAVLVVIQELVHQIPNPRWRVAALAAFRLPADQYLGPEHDSLTSRWRALARRDGVPEPEVNDRADAYRGYWIAAAARLAEDVGYRLIELNGSMPGWRTYRTGTPNLPPRSLPISFDRTDALYVFEGHKGVQSISYRWLTAHDPIDHYDAVGWYFNEPDAPVEIKPLANCTLDGQLRDLPQGGRIGTLRFSHILEAGERYFFAYITRFNSEQPCRPAILYEVRGREMRSLVVRAQFDQGAVPVRAWYFDVEAQTEGWAAPDDGSPQLIQISSNGYVDHEFTHCERARKYGLRWEWRRQG